MAGCRLVRAGCRLVGAGCRLVGAGCRLVGAGCRLVGAGCRLVRAGGSCHSGGSGGAGGSIYIELAGQVAVVEVLAQVLKVVTGRLEKPRVELSRRVGLVAKEVEHVAILNGAGPVVAKSS